MILNFIIIFSFKLFVHLLINYNGKDKLEKLINNNKIYILLIVKSFYK